MGRWACSGGALQRVESTRCRIHVHSLCGSIYSSWRLVFVFSPPRFVLFFSLVWRGACEEKPSQLYGDRPTVPHSDRWTYCTSLGPLDLLYLTSPLYLFLGLARRTSWPSARRGTAGPT